MPFIRGTRLPILNGNAPVVLPQAGPYAGLGIVYASSLTNFVSSSGSTNFGIQNRAAPFKRNNLTISGTKIMVPQQGSCFGWFNRISITGSAYINANGGNGGTNSGVDGGAGGSGGSGGGGGAAADSTLVTMGGVAGSGTDGTPGEDSDMGFGGGGGSGYANTRWAADGYTYPTGGNSDSLGGNGFGGAANGLNDATLGLGTCGGPGGGGIVCLVANYGSGTSVNATIQARGGEPGADDFTNFTTGGGGGSIIICLMHYTGTWTYDVNAGADGGLGGAPGTAKIYKIKADMSLTEMSWTDVW